MASREKLTPGKMLRDVREYYGIDKSSIAHGLCSEQTYYRIESGVIEPDGLLFACLWERMGMSLHRVSILLSDEEIEWFFLKADAFRAVQEMDAEQIRKLRKEMAVIGNLNEAISGQFLDYLDYVLEMIETGLTESAYEKIKNAVFRTIEDPLRMDLSTMRLGQEEIQLLCSYLCAEYHYNASQSSIIQECISNLNKYVNEEIADRGAQNGVLSRVAATWITLFANTVDPNDIISDVEIIRKTKGIYDLPLLLTYLGKCNVDCNIQYKKWGETLYWLFDEFADGYKYREEMIYPQLPHINEICDFIKNGRIDKGFTQEKVSEGICEPESYSRIESGKRRPHKKNLKQIVQRLDLEWGYFQGILITSEIKPFLKRFESEGLIKDGEYEKSIGVLEELESYIDMSIPQNVQYSGLQRIAIGLKQGSIEPVAAVNQLHELLALTEADGEIYRYYSPQESGVMLLLSNIYRRRLNEPDKSLEIAKRFLDNEVRKRMPDVWRMTQFNRIVLGLYNDMKCWKEETELSFVGVKDQLKTGHAQMLEQFLDLYAEGLGKGKISTENEIRLLVEAVYIADLYNKQSNSVKLKEFLKTYNTSIGNAWY